MLYPRRITPKFYFKKFLTETLQDRDIVLIRSTPTKNIKLSGSNDIDPKVVCEPRKNMDDLSLNIYGRFREPDGRIQFDVNSRKEYHDDWTHLNRRLIPKPEEISENTSKGFIYK